jgi:hypothetical protein
MILRRIIISIFFLGLLGLGVLFVRHNIRGLVRGPEIMISSPENGSSYGESFLTISGTTQRVSKIFLNNEAITREPSGDFRVSTLIDPGINEIVISVYDQYDTAHHESLIIYGSFPDVEYSSYIPYEEENTRDE